VIVRAFQSPSDINERPGGQPDLEAAASDASAVDAVVDPGGEYFGGECQLTLVFPGRDLEKRGGFPWTVGRCSSRIPAPTLAYAAVSVMVMFCSW
jgi:hypothetical protein